MFTLHILLKINGQDIKWDTIVQLYNKHCLASTSAPGLSILHKLRYEHIHLTSYSKMRVDLAAQVQCITHIHIQYVCTYMNMYIKFYYIKCTSAYIHA